MRLSPRRHSSERYGYRHRNNQGTAQDATKPPTDAVLVERETAKNETHILYKKNKSSMSAYLSGVFEGHICNSSESKKKKQLVPVVDAKLHSRKESHSPG